MLKNQEWDSVTTDNWQLISEVTEDGNKGNNELCYNTLKELSEKGSVYASLYIAHMMEKGEIVSLDKRESDRLYMKAARSGNIYAEFCYAKYLLRSDRNDEAFNIADKSAHGGYLPSIYLLAKMYLRGLGCEKNLESYRYYNEFAARKGHIWARRHMFVDMLKGKYGFIYMPVGALRFILLLPEIFYVAVKDPENTILEV